MIDIETIRTQKETVITALKRRGVPAEAVEKLSEIDAAWRQVSSKLEDISRQKNEAGDKIAKAAPDEKQALIAHMATVSSEEKTLREEEKELSNQREQAWRALPNIPLEDVPNGGEADFEVVDSYPKTIPTPSFPQKDYMTLGSAWIETERAGKVSGSRFTYITGQLARLEIALITWLMDSLSTHGFTPVLPPILIGEKAMAGMGYLDHAGEEIYKTQDGLYLIGTSEQALGPFHMDEILDSAALPIRYVGFSPSFRREAGSHGKDVKGILRLHQFDKVEMFSFTTPEKSQEEHEFVLERQKAIMDALELPYRVIKLAAQDLGTPSAKTYDIETWIPSEGTYRETHSTSNTTDYQARRLNIRIRNQEGKPEKAHMLNGTAIAMSRMFIALIENHQQPDGTIRIPSVLHPYVPFTTMGS